MSAGQRPCWSIRVYEELHICTSPRCCGHPTVPYQGKRAISDLIEPGPCRILHPNFRERTFSRTFANKGKKKGRGTITPVLARLSQRYEGVYVHPLAAGGRILGAKHSYL